MSEFPDDVQLAKVEIHVGELCNNRCSFCTTGWVNRDTRGLEEVPRETIRKQLELAYATGARRALFQGGEPTLRRDLGDLIGDAYGMGYEAVNVFTNARMAASRAGARWLTAMNVTWFQVSIQGGTAPMHDASVVAKGAFEQTVAGTRRLLANGQRVKVNAVLTRHLLESILPFADLMIDLGPEEIGMDLVSPSSAFDPGREDYPTLVPKMTPYLPSLVEAMKRMDEAGVVVRLTNFPACLARGVEHLVSAEAATTRTHTPAGTSVQKLLWRRSLQVKSEQCAACAYDKTCGGVYHAYATAHGTDELRPLAHRAPPVPVKRRRVADTNLTRALRELFARGTSDAFGVRAVRHCEDGSHELDCFAPRGDVRVIVRHDDDESPAYKRTAEFAISYQPASAGRPVDLRVVDAVVRALQRFETRWFAETSPEEIVHDSTAVVSEA